MGKVTSVAGANGGGAPQKAHSHGSHGSKVGGANGAPGKDAPTKVKGAKGSGDATQVGGAADAGKGAAQISGGGGTSLQAALDSLAAAVKSLAEAVQKMQVSGGGGSGCGMGTQVAGVRGRAATRREEVAKAASTVRTATDEDHAVEQRVLELINAERAKAGLAPVSYNGILDSAAEKHASHMSRVGRMAHDSIGDGDPGQRARAEGWRRAWGENVATGQTSPEQVVREWMNSPTHRRNIMDPDFRSMGVGYVTAANGRSYWAQEFGA